jgi:nicotinamide mononucleotide transporter
MSALEIAAFLISLVAVTLGALGMRFAWPWWVTGSILYGVFFYQSEYFASAALQLVFIAAAVWGWIGWGKDGAKPRYSKNKERLIIVGTIIVATLILYPTLIDIGATSSAIEAFGFTGSVIAQVLMVLQRFEAWPIWLVVNLAYTYQYFRGELYLTSVLYIVFALLAVFGWVRWQKESKVNAVPNLIK